MPSTLSISSIVEIPTLQCDSCIVDTSNNLIFLSVWGRDTAIQELFGRLTLKDKTLGLDSLSFDNHETAYIGDMERFIKRSTRTFKQTRFGTLINSWIFDHRCIELDKANHTAFILFKDKEQQSDDYLWSVIKDICPLPLLDGWKSVLFTTISIHQMLQPLVSLIGRCQGYRVQLDILQLEQIIAENIRTGLFTADEGGI